MIRREFSVTVPLLLAVVALAAIAEAADVGKTAGRQSGERIEWQVVGSGGGSGISTNYGVSGTVGQTAAGLGSSASYRMYHGFWQAFDSDSSCCVLAGDANGDGKINIGDAVYIITYILRDGPLPPCEAEADPNADGKINVGDAVYIIAYIFRDGPALMCP